MSTYKNRFEIGKDIRLYWRMICILEQYNPRWKIILLCVVTNGVMPFVAILLSSMLLNSLYAEDSMVEIILLALLGCLVSFLVFVMKHIAVYQKNVMWWGLAHRLEEPLIKKTAEAKYELTEHAKMRAILAKMEEYRRQDRNVFERFLERLEVFLTAVVKLLMSVSMIAPFCMSVISGGIDTWITAALLVVIMMGCVFLSHRSVKCQGMRKREIHKEHEGENRLNAYMMDEVVLSNEAGKDIRIYNQQKMMGAYGDQMNQNWREMTKQHASNDMKHLGLQGLLASVIGGIIYLYMAVCAMMGSISVGNVIRYAGGIQQLIQALTDIFTSWNLMNYDRIRMEEYFEYLDMDSAMSGSVQPDAERFVVEFQNVSFKYPEAEEYAIRNMNIRLDLKERMALVGRNGSGKSTFVKLLCRLYEPTEGRILLNGIDIREYAEVEYRKLFSVVFQDFQIFSLEMGENVAGNKSVDESRVMDALSRVGLTGLITKMPSGLKTLINKELSDDGVTISGGEAQKLAMARAIYKDAPIVILDEPTAALDPVSENEIYTHFHEVIGKKPALFISHRLSSCRFAEEILVFEEGNISQRGGHEELVDQEGIYRQMWYAQAQYYKVDN